MARAAVVALLSLAVLAPAAQAWVIQCYNSPLELACDYLTPSPSVLKALPASDGIHLTWWPALDGGVDKYLVHRCNLMTGPCEIPGAEEAEEDLEAWEVVYEGTQRRHVDWPATGAYGVYVYYVVGVGVEENVETRGPPSNPVAAAWPYCEPASPLEADVNLDCFMPLPFAGAGH